MKLAFLEGFMRPLFSKFDVSVPTTALLISSFIVLLVGEGLAADNVVPVHEKTSWPVDVCSDMKRYAKFLAKRDRGMSRSLRLTANRLLSARMLYPDYPKFPETRSTRRFHNCVPTLKDLKLLRKAADKYPYVCRDKALYSGIYFMRLIGRGSFRYWRVAPVGSVREAKGRLAEAKKKVLANSSNVDPAYIPILLGEAYINLHGGSESKAYERAVRAVSLARKCFGDDSRQLISTLRYAEGIFDSRKEGAEFKRMLDRAVKKAASVKPTVDSKADFYY